MSIVTLAAWKRRGQKHMVLIDPQKHRDMSSKDFQPQPTGCFLICLLLAILLEDLSWAPSSIGNVTEDSGRGHERDINNDPMPAAFYTLRCAHFMTTVLGINKGWAKSFFRLGISLELPSNFRLLLVLPLLIVVD